MVYIILVNWHGWKDTIECLESVFRLAYPDFRVIVCDNNSQDESLNRIADWARGGIEAASSNPELAPFTIPPVRKPIAFLQLTREDQIDLSVRTEKLVLVQMGVNLGFAAGNNGGLRLALNSSDFAYAWLLNNDTVVDPGSLSALVAKMQLRPDVGMCGSTLLYYDRPGTVQALGGSQYNFWTGRGGHIGLGQHWCGQSDSASVERRMKYVVGASIFLRRRFLEAIGPMNETYFLYCEEIDWAVRARRRFTLAYAPESIVYHKEGQSIGTSAARANRSPKSEYYAARSCMLLAQRYLPIACLGVVLALLARALFRLVSGNRRGSEAVLRGIWSSLSGTEREHWCQNDNAP